tara:strand:+ start:63512 stop:64222 length:711 start_codon:yes stop_codon:yes gene_type:complete
LAILAFPPIEEADENGLLAFGGDLEVSSLVLAYSQGIFPWPISDRYPLAWFSPDPRGVVEFSNLHLPRSLKKSLRQNEWIITFNKNFDQVINECSKLTHRKGESSSQGTWITDDIIRSYTQFHQSGYAYSVEVWLEDELVGGLYGTRLGRCFSGESMFHKQTNASKIALASLMYFLKSHDINWLDTQMVTSVVENLGGSEIPRDEFIHKLNALKNLNGDDIFEKDKSYHALDLISI